jgi:hypothetical protein
MGTNSGSQPAPPAGSSNSSTTNSGMTSGS